MKTFTFLVDQMKRCDLISQLQSDELNRNLLLTWADNTCYVPMKLKPFLRDEIIKWSDPQLKESVDNVWWDIYGIDAPFDDYYLSYIIGTDSIQATLPLVYSSRFIFTTHFPGSRRMQQFDICTLEEGLILWANSINFLNRKQRKILLKYLLRPKWQPIPVEGLKNVWTVTYKIHYSKLILYIVKGV
mgnify:CR=1 FL=1